MSTKLVAILSPVFTAVAGVVTAAAAKYGLHFNPTEVVSVESGAMLAAGSTALKWLHDQRKFVEFEAHLKVDAEEAARYAGVKLTPGEVEAKLQALIVQLAEHASGAKDAETRLKSAEEALAQEQARELEARNELAKLKAAVAEVRSLAETAPADTVAAPEPQSFQAA